jgi:hypothetical protein
MVDPAYVHERLYWSLQAGISLSRYERGTGGARPSALVSWGSHLQREKSKQSLSVAPCRFQSFDYHTIID